MSLYFSFEFAPILAGLIFMSPMQVMSYVFITAVIFLACSAPKGIERYTQKNQRSKNNWTRNNIYYNGIAPHLTSPSQVLISWNHHPYKWINNKWTGILFIACPREQSLKIRKSDSVMLLHPVMLGLRKSNLEKKNYKIPGFVDWSWMLILKKSAVIYQS